jgi:hypothetical protein
MRSHFLKIVTVRFEQIERENPYMKSLIYRTRIPTLIRDRGGGGEGGFIVTEDSLSTT